MKQNRIRNRVMGLAALSSLLSWAAIMGASAQTRTTSLEAGSVLPVKLDDALSSNNSRKGDTFTATIRNDTDTEYYRLPTGTRVEGVVRDARPKQDKDPGVLDLEFRRLRFPDGKSYAIEGSLIGLDNKSVEKRSDGRLVAKPGHKTDRLTYVGYGAGAGLIVGLLTKHGLEDTVIGGGLGYLFGSLQKGGSNSPNNVTLKQGTELGVRVDRQVTLANYGSQDDYNNYRNRNSNSPNGTDADRNRSDDARYHRANGDTDVNSRYRRDDNSNRSDNYRPDDNRTNQDRRGDRLNSEDRNIRRDRANTSDIGMMIGDRDVTFASTARPFMSHGIVMLPVRSVLEAAHIPFTYDAPSQQVRASGDGGRVRLALNSAIAVVDGTRRVDLGAPAQRLNGTLYVPMRFFNLLTGGDVTYDSGSRTVIMKPRDSREDTHRDEIRHDETRQDENRRDN